jgi:hypothetical protein
MISKETHRNCNVQYQSPVARKAGTHPMTKLPCALQLPSDHPSSPTPIQSPDTAHSHPYSPFPSLQPSSRFCINIPSPNPLKTSQSDPSKPSPHSCIATPLPHLLKTPHSNSCRPWCTVPSLLCCSKNTSTTANYIVYSNAPPVVMGL